MEKTVKAFSYYEDFIFRKGSEIEEFLDELRDAFASIPPELRDAAILEIEGYGDDYGSSVKIEIAYKREETSAEREEHARRAEAQRQRSIAQEKKMLAALKAKYE